MGIEDTTPPDLLTIPHVSRRLSVSERFTKTLVSTGQLPSLRIGRVRRIRASDLERFIRERAEEQTLVTADRSTRTRRRRRQVPVG